MKHQATKGHLQHGSLHLKQTEQGRKKMGKGMQVKHHLLQLPAPALNWKTKEK